MGPVWAMGLENAEFWIYRVYRDVVYLGRVLGSCCLLLGLQQGPDTAGLGKELQFLPWTMFAHPGHS